MIRCERIVKKLQRRIYDVLLTKYGLLMIIFCIIIIITSLINFGDSLIEYRILQSKASVSLIQEKRFLDEPIDVVYTWVNGSDPKHLEELKSFKISQRNNSTEHYRIIEFSNFVASLDNLSKSISSDNKTELMIKTINEWDRQTRCFYKFCMKTNNILVIQPQLNYDTKYLLLATLKTDFINKSFIYNQISIDTIGNNSILLFNFDLKLTLDLEDLNSLNQIFNRILFKNGFKIYLGYFTIDCSVTSNCIRHLNKTIIIKSVLKNAKLPKYINDGILQRSDYALSDYTEDYHANKNTKIKDKSENNANYMHFSALKVKSSELFLNLTNQQSIKIPPDQSSSSIINLDIYPASLSWDLGDAIDEDISPNRFQDNDELKYSFRSLEKYAPWIRNVYLVTNGQIPSWLNLSHPKIRIVTHKEIFINRSSHLPTFSSPAIESHLHRINGLSTHFLYFNDDVMLGSGIYREDFYTQSKGYKVYLAWSLPGCNRYCPNAWIKDGYCDKACNTSECEFDGGDCLRPKNLPQQVQSASSLMSSICSPGCTYTWLGDRFCDSPCNTKECGFDLGDCGVKNFMQLFQVELFDQNSLKHIEKFENMKLNFKIPQNLTGFFINFTLNDFNSNHYNIQNAFVEKNDKIRAIGIINKYKTITFSLKTDQNTTQQTYNLHFLLSINTSHYNLSRNFTIILVESNNISKFTSTILPLTTTKPNFFKDITQIEPSEVKLAEIKYLPYYNYSFNDKIIEDIFTNYYEYLNWALNQGYLSQKGFEYKLNYFAFKLRNLNISISDNLFDEDINLWQLYDEYLLNLYEKNTSKSIFFKKRKLQDTFADSLRFVNKLFNDVYGFMPRKVPAHMPHFINKHIINELQQKFKNQYEKTSEHRLRSKDDMQFSFSYFYYLMSEPKYLSMGEIFDEFDLDQNGILIEKELRLFGLRNDDTNASLDNLIKNCSNNNQLYIKRDDFVFCKPLERFIQENIWTKKTPKRYKFEVIGEDDIQFQMISNGDVQKMEKDFNEILKQPKKFICINDNIDHKLLNEAEKLKAILNNFYETLYPLQSSFEKSRDLPISPSNFFIFNQKDFFNFYLLIVALVFSFLIIVLLFYFKFLNCSFLYLIMSKNRGKKYLIRKRRTEQLRRLSQRKDSSSSEDNHSGTYFKKSNKKSQFIL